MMMMTPGRNSVILLVATMAGLAPSAGADVLVSNLAEPLRASSSLGNNPNPVAPPDEIAWYWAAQSFATDDQTSQLLSIDAIVGDASLDPAPVVIAGLYADDNGAIGALLTTMIAPGVDGPPTARTFLPADPITLEANTAYWFLLGVEAPVDGTFFWSYANSNDSTGPGSLLAYAYSADSGATWSNGIDFPYFLQVDVSTPNDTDGDGVDDDTDVCCNTPAGALVDAAGRPVGDLDFDCDNDLDDYALYAQGITGPLNAPAECP